MAKPARPIGEQLGLGAKWAPAPAAWGWASFDTPTGKTHVLVLETVAGRVGVVFDPASLQRFVAQALEHSSGLVVPPQ